jgi:AraC family ethanolamine operon transcriptional activator
VAVNEESQHQKSASFALDRWPAGKVGVVRGDFTEFDQFAEAIAGWDLDWRQLDAGRLRAEMTQVDTATASITRFSFNRRFFQCGSVPKGTRTYGLPEEGSPRSVVRGQAVNAQSLLAFPDDYTATSERGFRAHGLSFSEELLRETAEREGVAGLLERLDAHRLVVPCDPAAIGSLRSRVRWIINGLESRWSRAAMISLRRELDVEVPSLLVRALVSGAAADNGYPAPAGNREVVARRAREFIDHHAEQAPSIEEVSRHVCASLRTLRYAFRECYGVSPKAYLQSLRLNRVRGELRTADSETLVADVAHRWGFWHMGQFAADYRRLFGELPSETRR